MVPTLWDTGLDDDALATVDVDALASSARGPTPASHSIAVDIDDAALLAIDLDTLVSSRITATGQREELAPSERRQSLHERCTALSARAEYVAPKFDAYVVEVASGGGSPQARLQLHSRGPPPQLLQAVLELHSTDTDCPVGPPQGNAWVLPLHCRSDHETSMDWQAVLQAHYRGADVSRFPSPAMLAELAAPPDEARAAAREAQVPAALCTALRDFQRESLRFALRQQPQWMGRVLLADEMGLGKTLQALALASALSDKWPLLVICPSSMRDVWVEAVERWLPAVEPREMCVLRRRWDMVCQRKVTVVSTKMAAMLATPVLTLHARVPFGTLIVDESHCLQHTPGSAQQSQLFQLVQQLVEPRAALSTAGLAAQGTRPRGARLILLSGTPMTRDPISMYGQLRLLRPSVFTSYKAFGFRYCDRWDEPRWSGVNANSSGEFHLYLSRCLMVRRAKETVARDIPSLERRVQNVHLDGRQQAVLAELSSKLSDAEADATTSRRRLSMLRLRLWQATGLAKAGSGSTELAAEEDGWSDVDERPTVDRGLKAKRALSKSKRSGRSDGDDDDDAGVSAVAWLQRKLAELMAGDRTSKMLIFAHHVAVMDALATRIEAEMHGTGASFVRMDGSVPASERTPLIAQFQNDASCRVALLSLTALGVGVTMTAADTVVFFELFPQWVAHSQAEARAHRIGQTRPVSVHYLLASGSFDERTWPALLKQKAVQERALNTVAPGATSPPAEDGTGAGVAGRDASVDAAEGITKSVASSHGSGPLRRRRPAFAPLYTPDDTAPAEATMPPVDAVAATSGSNGATLTAELPSGESSADASALEALFALGASDVVDRAAACQHAVDRWLESSAAFWPSRWSERVYVYETDDDLLVNESRAGRKLGLRHTFLNFAFEGSPLSSTAYAEDPLAALPVELQSEALNFLVQWRALPKEHRRLLADYCMREDRPLRLPLATELRRAETNAVPSTKRYTRRDAFGGDDVSVTWRSARDAKTGACVPRTWSLRRNPARGDDFLCFYCNGERDEAGGMCEVGAPFCSMPCSESWALQVGAGDAIRRQLFERDRGVCKMCEVDCHQLFLQLRPMNTERRRELLRTCLGGRLSERRRRRLAFHCFEGGLWEADHTTAVADGGGEVGGISGFQTLCVPCHQQKTREEHQARREARRRPADNDGSCQPGEVLVGPKRPKTRDGEAPPCRANKCSKCGQPKKGHVCTKAGDDGCGKLPSMMQLQADAPARQMPSAATSSSTTGAKCLVIDSDSDDEC